MVLSNEKKCTNRLSVPARLDHLKKAGQVIEVCAKIAGFDERTNYACQLAIEEVCENIIKHGYGAEDIGTIEIIAQAEPGKLSIEIIDFAPPFNPAEAAQDAPVSLDDPPIGGLGLRIIHKVMDKVAYQRRGDQNHLFLLKTSTNNVE